MGRRIPRFRATGLTQTGIPLTGADAADHLVMDELKLMATRAPVTPWRVEPACLGIDERLRQLHFGIHDERARSGVGLVERLTRCQQHP
jgi:hypothetical protein